MKTQVASTTLIAEKSGYSQQTVSRVLGNKAHLHSDKAVKKIRAIAEDYGYRPNNLVEGLLRGRTKTVGIMVPFRQDNFYAQMVAGCQDSLIARDYAPLLMMETPLCDSTTLIHRLVDQRVDGVVIRPSSGEAGKACLKLLERYGIHTVAINSLPPHEENVDFVGTDDWKGGVMAARHLLGLGQRRANFVAFTAMQSWHEESPMGQRWEGFREAFEAGGGTCQKHIMVGESLEPLEAGKPFFLKLLQQQSGLPGAFFLGMDYLARGLYAAAAEHGLRIPEDIRVVGFGDLEFARWMMPPLSTVRQSPYDIGTRATELLFECLNGQRHEKHIRQIRLVPELKVRCS